MPVLSQDKANMEDPQQHFAWALSPIPIDINSTPLVLPLYVLPYISQHLYRLGFRHHPELQELVASADDATQFMAGGVRWIPKEEKEQLPPPIDLSNLTDEEVTAVQEALDRRKNDIS